jgi:hypothetical protein
MNNNFRIHNLPLLMFEIVVLVTPYFTKTGYLLPCLMKNNNDSKSKNNY